MSGKYEFDKTRDAIGMDNISADERATMLEKFKNSGGEILKEKTFGKEKTSSFRKSRAIASDDRFRDIPSRSQKTSHRGVASGKSRKKSKKSQDKWYQKPKKGFLDLLFFRIKASLSGTTSFTGNKIKENFAKFIVEELQSALLLLHGNLSYFFTGHHFIDDNQQGIQKIIEKLDEENPIFLEILDHLHSLYNFSYFNKIDEALQSSSDGDISITKVIEPIKDFYLKLYYLSPWISTTPTIVNRLYQAYTQEFPEEKDAFKEKVKEMIKIINHVLKIAMKNYFLIICCDAKAIFEPTSKAFQNYIGFDPEASLGNRVIGEACKAMVFINQPNEPEENSDGSDTSKEEEEDDNDPITETKEYQYGKLLMSKLGPKKMREKHDSKHYHSSLEDLDKGFLSAMYFKEFDFEYSPVLITKQVHYNIDTSYGVKKDYSRILPELITSSRNIDQTFEEYSSMVKELKDLKSDPQGSYIEQSKRETVLQSKINSQTSVLKRAILSSLQKIVSNLATLIASMKEGKNIVLNMEDVLSLGGELDRKKKLSGRKIKEAITEAYCYSLALKYQIESGNLRGVGNLNEMEVKRLLGNTKAQPFANEPPSKDIETDSDIPTQDSLSTSEI